jgi:starvation-inducible DNA-binding protein
MTQTVKRSAADYPRFQPPNSTITELQAVLVDLIELHLQSKQAHWNVVGPTFRSLHLHLDEIVDTARNAADAIAERIRALQSTPDGRSGTVAQHAALESFPPGEQSTDAVTQLILDRLAVTIACIRGVFEDVDAGESVSADLLNGIAHDLEKHAWMLDATRVS